MKRLFSFWFAVALILTLPFMVIAQDDKEAKNALYKKFTEAYNRGKELKKADVNLTQPNNKAAYENAAREAYAAAKEYVQKYPNDDDDIARFQKKYVAEFEIAEKGARKLKLSNLVDAKKYDESFTLGKEILADEPDDLLTLFLLSRAGLLAAFDNNNAYNAAVLTHARKGIQLLQAGGTFTGVTKDEALGVLNYAIGMATIRSTPGEAVTAFKQVATLENGAKDDPLTYYLLGAAYEASEYDKLSSDYKTQCATSEQAASPACKSMSERINLVVDRIIDAYARAVSLSGTDAKFATSKVEWMKQLTDYYKYRHEGSDQGLNELIAGVISKPLP